MISVYPMIIWCLLRFLSKSLPLEIRIQGSEVLFILPKAYIFLLFHELKVASLSVIAIKISHPSSKRSFKNFDVNMSFFNDSVSDYAF